MAWAHFDFDAVPASSASASLLPQSPHPSSSAAIQTETIKRTHNNNNILRKCKSCALCRCPYTEVKWRRKENVDAERLGRILQLQTQRIVWEPYCSHHVKIDWWKRWRSRGRGLRPGQSNLTHKVLIDEGQSSIGSISCKFIHIDDS
jgi:hypothetical protein